MDEIFEYLNSEGKWKLLHVLTWEEALKRSDEFGYIVRRVKLHYVVEEYTPDNNRYR